MKPTQQLVATELGPDYSAVYLDQLQYEPLGKEILAYLAASEAEQRVVTDAIEKRIAFDARIEQKLAAAGYKDTPP